MDGRNLFESRAMKILGPKFAGSDPRLGVFISHSRLDKQKARAVARALEASKVDYYFDENDEELQLADEQHDDVKVVRCIENGIKVCSHLLGIITENTKTSWWVPYEIGSANGSGRGCAHLIDREVNRLPSYIRAARVPTSRVDLREWLASDVTKASSAIVELAQRLAAALDYPDFIPADRSLHDLTFY
jgi:hypothetical protein